MNEQRMIKKMIAKARRQASKVETPGSSAYESLVFEKFAELIVRECASLAYDGPRGILEHFGVKQ